MEGRRTGEVDGVNLFLRCLIFLEEEICRGKSLADALLGWIKSAADMSSSRLRDSYDRVFLNQFMTASRYLEEGRSLSELNFENGCETGLYRERLFWLLESGYAGAPVLRELRALKSETLEQLELDLKNHVERLPLKMLLPLLLLMFPAFLILLFGPMMTQLLSVMQ